MTAINPLNPNNVLATASNTVTSDLTGTQTTLGGEIYNLTHGYVVRSNGEIVSVGLSPLDVGGIILDPTSSYFGDSWYSTLASAQAASNAITNSGG